MHECAVPRILEAAKLQMVHERCRAQDSPGFRYQTVIHHCSLCDHPINDGSERLFTGSYDSPKGECRCIVAPPNSDFTLMCHTHMLCSPALQLILADIPSMDKHVMTC